MIQTALLRSAVLLSALTALCLCQEDFEVINIQRFGPGMNTIELECRSNLTGSAIPNAQFWLNEVSSRNELRALGITVTVRPNHQIVFQITQQLEGRFFCGEDLLTYGTRGRRLVAYPNAFQIPSEERVFFAKVGTTAHLKCSILPGALLELYFADWINATSSTEVARHDGPRRSVLLTAPSPRFSVNEEDFSLMIDSVTLSDAGRYRCALGVSDPAGSLMRYLQTEILDLTLVVYQAPIITEPPENQIIALSDSDSNQSVTFHCETRGKPLPEIVWLHDTNTRRIELENNEKYSIRTQTHRTGSGDYFVGSWLTIQTVNAFDSGAIVCRIMADDDDLPTDLQTVESTAELAVIGSFNRLTLLISQSRDIIFKLMLPVPIRVPVQLSIVYMDANNPERMSQPRLTNNIYNNTQLITHLEPSFQVPRDFDYVRIRIALQFQNLRGPFNISDDTFNIQTPNVLTKEEASVAKTTVISAACSVTVFGVLVAILITILTCVTCRLTVARNKRKHQTEEDKNIAAIREHKDKIGILEKQMDTDLKKLKLSHEAEAERERQKHKDELDERKDQRKHEINMKLISIHADEMSKVENGWRVVYIVDGIELIIEKKAMSGTKRNLTITESNSSTDSYNTDSSGVDMTDYASHDVYSMSHDVYSTSHDIDSMSHDIDSMSHDVDSMSHDVYSAHAAQSVRYTSNKRHKLCRGMSIDVESSDNRLEREIMVDCVQTIIKASVEDAVLGPTIKRLVSIDTQL